MFSTHLRSVLVAVCVGLLASVQGYGRLMDPPSRSSMWRVGFDTPKNFKDDQLSCGGIDHQWNKMNGKCGVCGDPYDGVRENEAGGIYATGTIGEHYQEGQVITAGVDLFNNDFGWFEFRLCVNNDVNQKATQECLDKHLLQLADGSGTRLSVGGRRGHYKTQLRLPAGVTCDQCVLQWKFHTENTRDENMVNQCKGPGCSDPQAEFYGCADVAIQSANAPIPIIRRQWGYRRTTRRPGRRTTRRHHRTTPRHHRRTTPRTRFCRATGIWANNFQQNVWCRLHCHITYCPSVRCRCD